MEWNKNNKEERNHSTSNVDGVEEDMENDDEVGVVDSEMHIGNDDSQHEENNVESASEDSVTKEEIIPQRQEQG